MSGKQWVLTESKEFTPGWSRVHVVKSTNLDSVDNEDNKVVRPIIEDQFFKFSLVYSDMSRMVGYRFDYRNRDKQPRKALYSMYQTFNSALWCFSPKKESPTFEVLYEDQVLRLLMYEHTDKKCDYWLVGRWREDMGAVNAD